MFKLGLDVAYDSFPAGSKLARGQDVTEMLKQPTEWMGACIPVGSPPMKATIETVIGPGGGNPYVYFTFDNREDAYKWFRDTYNEGAGLSPVDLEEEFAMAAYAN